MGSWQGPNTNCMHYMYQIVQSRMYGTRTHPYQQRKLGAHIVIIVGMYIHPYHAPAQATAISEPISIYP